jgi:integrase
VSTSPYTRFAMQLMALTFVRTGELIGARWEEFDLDAAEWRIPAARMKMKTPHIVPLSNQAVDVLRCLHELKGRRNPWSSIWRELKQSKLSASMSTRAALCALNSSTRSSEYLTAKTKMTCFKVGLRGMWSAWSKL